MAVYLAPGVYVEEFDSGPVPLAGGATAVPAFVGFTEKIPTVDDKEGGKPDLRPRMVTSWTQYKQHYGGFGLGDWKKGHRALLPPAVLGYFNNGGSRAYVVPIPWTEPRDNDRPELEAASTSYYLDKDSGLQGIPAADVEAPDDWDPAAFDEITEVPGAEDESAFALQVRTDFDDGEVAVAIEPCDETPDDPTTYGLRVRVNGREVLHLPKVEVGSASETVVTKLKDARKDDKNFPKDLISVIEGAGNPKHGRYLLARPEPHPRDVSTGELKGEDDPNSGIASLKIHDDVTMLIVPDLYNVARFEFLKNNPDSTDWTEVDLPTWKAVQTAMITHCELETNRMAILDPPPSMQRPDQIEPWRANTAMYDSQHAAMYYPWIEITDAVTDRQMYMPPSGHMAGVWARTDSTRGVWKAPANEVIQGATGVHYKMTSAEQEVLNPNGINAIRPFGTRGIRVWGARTMSSNANWNYVPVRRLFSWIEKTIMDGTQWVVFEPNDQATWDRVTRTVSNFLTGLWRDGALFGASPAEAFYVKCDAETNPPDSIDVGKLICEVGIRPVKPAEFVVFRVTQWKPA